MTLSAVSLDGTSIYNIVNLIPTGAPSPPDYSVTPDAYVLQKINLATGATEDLILNFVTEPLPQVESETPTESPTTPQMEFPAPTVSPTTEQSSGTIFSSNIFDGPSLTSAGANGMASPVGLVSMLALALLSLC